MTDKNQNQPRPLHVIAADVRRAWRRKDGSPAINFAAVPYLDAMHQLDGIGGSYGYDSAASIVRYFLANATAWRGDDARRIKAELRALLDTKPHAVAEDAPLYIKQPNGRYAVAEPEAITAAALTFAADRMQREPIRSPADTAEFLRLKLQHLEHEVFAVVYLDNRHRVIDYAELFRGTIDGTSVYPREVVKEALKHNAAAVILAHNHPSGIAEPSQADERITTRLKAALELIDVRLLDHLVIGAGTHTSLASRGLL